MRRIVKDNIDYEKDDFTGAILNRNSDVYNNVVERKRLRAQKENEMNDLKSQVEDLTKLVSALIQKLDK